MNEAKKRKIRKVILDNISLIIFVLLVVVSSFLSDSFLTARNLTNILRQQFPYMLVALGAMLAIMTGGIDLASGQILGFASTFLVVLMQSMTLDTVPKLLLGVLIVVLASCVFGAISGVLISYFKMAAFIVTLAITQIASGVAYIICNGQPLRLDASWASTKLLNSFTDDRWLGIPICVYFAFLIVLIFVFLIKYTPFGRLIMATGSNDQAVRLSGINEKAYRMSAYIIGAGLAAFAGIYVTCRTSMSTPSTGSGGYELDAIAAVVIGGANLTGGKASVVNTILGVFVLALIGNIMNLMSIAAYPQKVVKGIIIIIAVLFTTVADKRSTK